MDDSPSVSIASVNGGANLAADQINNGGDVVGRDKIVQNIQHIYERALSAAKEAEQAKSIEASYLAQGVSDLAKLKLRSQVVRPGTDRRPVPQVAGRHPVQGASW